MFDEKVLTTDLESEYDVTSVEQPRATLVNPTISIPVVTDDIDSSSKIKTLLSEIKQKRTKLEEIASRSEELSRRLEVKLATYLDGSKNLPSVGPTGEILESLAGLYKIESDTQERVIKSIEKEIELTNKFLGNIDTEDETALLTQEMILKVLEGSRTTKYTLETK